MTTPENFIEYLSAHRDCTEELMDDARMLSVEDLETGTDPKTVKIRRMISAVRTEIHRMRGFVRLVPLADDISCGYMEPEHNIGRFVAQSFAQRFPNTDIILGNDRHTWRGRFSDEGMTYSKGPGMRETMEEMEKLAYSLSQKSDTEKLWRTYYISQYSPERKNLTLFRKHMPEKALDAAGLHMERTAETMPLASFY